MKGFMPIPGLFSCFLDGEELYGQIPCSTTHPILVIKGEGQRKMTLISTELK